MTTSGGPRALQPVAIAGHWIYPVLLPIPIVCFVGALVTDLAYTGTADMMWLDFSTWLLLAGLVGGGVAGVLLIVELARAGHARTRTLSTHFVLLLAAWTVEIFNSFIHARDGWTAVVPAGMTLSIAAALLALLAGWFWQVARHGSAGEAK
jgi:uncharacterized membrane protein